MFHDDSQMWYITTSFRSMSTLFPCVWKAVSENSTPYFAATRKMCLSYCSKEQLHIKNKNLIYWPKLGVNAVFISIAEGSGTRGDKNNEL